MAKYRTHSKEVKLEAVKMVTEQSVPKAQVARNLGISSSLLDGWIERSKDHPIDPFPGRGKLSANDHKVQKLERENEQLKMELDFLKKAVMFLDNQPK